MEGLSLELTYANLPKMFYSFQKPAIVPDPQMVIFNQELACTLGLNPDELKTMPELFAGNVLPSEANPISQAYAGYQFGHFTMLGDGRAVLIGEQIAPDGRRFDLQLKGSGRTPYSRSGDGLAALAPMLREYIVSEAMFHLGIPTTRSLAVVLTGQDVFREKIKQGAVLMRVAESHIRVGTFDYISSFGTEDDLRILSDYCIQRHFSWLENSENKYLMFLREVCQLQASLIAKWLLVGFIHGVMNTDNMAISGETIDYGPCAFMNAYDPDTVFSSIDTYGRYAYKNQPKIGAWNLSRFAEALLPLIDENKSQAIKLAEDEISNYLELYKENWLAGMRTKLGLVNHEEDDTQLITELLDLMKDHKLDYTNTFRSLSFEGQENLSLFEISEFVIWHEKWNRRLSQENQRPQHIRDVMKKHNPSVIPRNHRVEAALSAAENGDYTVTHDLLEALSKPFEDSEVYSQPPEDISCGYKTFCGT